MEIKEPKFKVGDKVIDILNNEQLIVSEIIYYRFYDDNYLYVLNFNDGERFGYEDELHLTPYVEKPKSVWNLKKGDKYYCLSEYCRISKFTWDDTPFDKNVLEAGNAFLTKEEAEFELERRKIEAKMLQLGGRRKMKRDEDNYYISYDEKTGNFAYLMRIWVNVQGLIFFDSAIDAIDAVQEIGEDRIKKYIFGV